MVLHDIRVGIRNLARRPAFAATAVLLLALGAGANAAVFSVVRGVLLRPLPFESPDRLVAIWPDTFVSNDDVAFWRRRAHALASVATVSPGWLMALASDDAPPVKITAAKVSDNLFSVLGVSSALGRPLQEGESTPGRDRVVVLSSGLWQQRFAADPAVIGRMVLVDQVPHEVVGVMPEGFEALGRATDLWLPAAYVPGSPQHRQTTALALGRLRPDITVDAATRELVALAPEMRRTLAHPDDWGRTLHALPLQESITGKVRPTLGLLLGAVGFILLLGAVNLGTLVLGGAIARAGELAVRSAIGASRGRLIRQLLIEQAVLATSGSLVGLGLARMALPWLTARIPPEVPRQSGIALDLVVFGVILLTTVGLAVSMALVPAILAARPGVDRLRQQAGTETPGRQRALGMLVVAQVALALVLGIGATLMLRTLWHLQHVDPGFDPSGVLTFRLQSTSTYQSLSTGMPYVRRVGERMGAIPGVSALGAINHLPMSGYAWTTRVHRPDRPPSPGEAIPHAGWRFIWGDYFAAMRIPLLAGRLFRETDVDAAAGVAIVNERLARAHFGSVRAALGRRLIQQGGGRPGPFEVEIVGIVGDVRHIGLETPPAPEIYRPLQQTFMFPMQFVLRTEGSPGALAAVVREAAFEVDRTVPVADLQALPSVLAASLGRPRLVAWLLSVFAAIGILLSVVGLHGVVALRVGQRLREIAIRLALGAAPSSVTAGVLRQGVLYAAGGLAVGIPTALGVTRFMDSVIFGVTTRDPLTFVALPVLLVCVTLLACYIPARRAGRVDAAAILRRVH